MGNSCISNTTSSQRPDRSSSPNPRRFESPAKIQTIPKDSFGMPWKKARSSSGRLMFRSWSPMKPMPTSWALTPLMLRKCGQEVNFRYFSQCPRAGYRLTPSDARVRALSPEQEPGELPSGRGASCIQPW